MKELLEVVHRHKQQGNAMKEVYEVFIDIGNKVMQRKFC